MHHVHLLAPKQQHNIHTQIYVGNSTQFLFLFIAIIIRHSKPLILTCVTHFMYALVNLYRESYCSCETDDIFIYVIYTSKKSNHHHRYGKVIVYMHVIYTYLYVQYIIQQRQLTLFSNSLMGSSISCIVKVQN